MVNGKRIYDLMPDKITLVKYNGSIPADSTIEDGGSDVTDPGSGGSGSDSSDTENPSDGGGSSSGDPDFE